MREFDKDDITFFQANLVFWAPYPGYTNFYYNTKEFKLADGDSIDLFYEWFMDNR